MSALAVVLAFASAACLGRGGSRAGKSDAGVDGGDGEGGGGGSPTSHEGVPVEANALTLYLTSGSYLKFQHQASPHPSSGPHEWVRTFFNAKLAASLGDGNFVHPAGAAAVAEIYGPDAATLVGWAVSVKSEADSAGGAGWYWYELVGPNGVAGQGPNYCSACHEIGQDYVVQGLAGP